MRLFAVLWLVALLSGLLSGCPLQEDRRGDAAVDARNADAGRDAR